MNADNCTGPVLLTVARLLSLFRTFGCCERRKGGVRRQFGAKGSGDWRRDAYARFRKCWIMFPFRVWCKDTARSETRLYCTIVIL